MLCQWILAGLFGKFASQLGASETTGYNWTDPNNVPLGKLCHVELPIKILPPALTHVSRVIGECVPITIRTQRVKLEMKYVNGSPLIDVLDLKRC